jgi:hypothetical protein
LIGADAGQGAGSDSVATGASISGESFLRGASGSAEERDFLTTFSAFVEAALWSNR